MSGTFLEIASNWEEKNDEKLKKRLLGKGFCTAKLCRRNEWRNFNWFRYSNLLRYIRVSQMFKQKNPCRPHHFLIIWAKSINQNKKIGISIHAFPSLKPFKVLLHTALYHGKVSFSFDQAVGSEHHEDLFTNWHMIYQEPLK